MQEISQFCPNVSHPIGSSCTYVNKAEYFGDAAVPAAGQKEALFYLWVPLWIKMVLTTCILLQFLPFSSLHPDSERSPFSLAMQVNTWMTDGEEPLD